MKTYIEMHGRWGEHSGMTEAPISVTNVDDVIRYARDAGETDLLVSEDTMGHILRFAMANSQVLPWEYIADGWIPKMYGVKFHKQ